MSSSASSETPDAPPFADRATGSAAVATMFLVILDEWDLAAWAGPASAAMTVLLVALLAMRVRWGRVMFVVVALGLVLADIATQADWLSHVEIALERAAFIAGFFTALATLRHVADGSPAIRACGRFLAQQPPGRRYAALTVGGQLFALLLNYGAIVLLGSLSVASASEEPNDEIRRHRTRRMLLAIQRGFISTLPWSPLSFAIAISTALVPGAEWTRVVLPCLGTGVIIAVTGWALDTAFKPRLSAPPPPRTAPEGDWKLILPLAGLLGLLVTLVAILNFASGVRIIGVVLVVVPAISLGWLILQSPSGVARSVSQYAHRELPGYRGELVLLMMAGFIGSLGSVLLVPVIEAAGLDLTAVPTWLLLASFVWLIPLAGQIGANPILTVSLLAPSLPSPETLGVSATDVIVAITAGWALSGVNSPFTATTLLTGNFGGVSARHVGLRWNGVYSLVLAVLLSFWVVLNAVV